MDSVSTSRNSDDFAITMQSYNGMYTVRELIMQNVITLFYFSFDDASAYLMIVDSV